MHFKGTNGLSLGLTHTETHIDGEAIPVVCVSIEAGRNQVITTHVYDAHQHYKTLPLGETYQQLARFLINLENKAEALGIAEEEKKLAPATQKPEDETTSEEELPIDLPAFKAGQVKKTANELKILLPRLGDQLIFGRHETGDVYIIVEGYNGASRGLGTIVFDNNTSGIEYPASVGLVKMINALLDQPLIPVEPKKPNPGQKPTPA